MVYRRNIRSKKQSSSKRMTRRMAKRRQPTNTIKHHSNENLDDETKLAKRHLTKEMWQLISIAVKRMADELIAISNNQRATNQDLSLTLGEIKTDPERSLSTTTIQQTKQLSNAGAGDEPNIKENVNVGEGPIIKRRTSPLQMLETLSNTKKKKENSNNAKRQSIKPKKAKKILKKKAKKTNQRLHNHRK